MLSFHFYLFELVLTLVIDQQFLKPNHQHERQNKFKVEIKRITDQSVTETPGNAPAIPQSPLLETLDLRITSLQYRL